MVWNIVPLSAEVKRRTLRLVDRTNTVVESGNARSLVLMYGSLLHHYGQTGDVDLVDVVVDSFA